MSSVSSIAMSGLNAASLRLQASANAIANAGASDPNTDTAGEAAELLMARIEFAANAEILRADSKMTQALLDITV